MNYFLEFFSDIGPKKLESIGEIDGVTIYSNQGLRDATKDWLSKSKITKKISDKLNEGIENKWILIGYKKSRMSSFLLYRLSQWTKHNLGLEKGYILGWFSKSAKKIVVLMDDNINLSGRPINEIPPTLLHECIHMGSCVNNKLFLKLFLNDLTNFYRIFLDRLDDEFKKVSDNDIKDAIKNISNISDGGNVYYATDIIRFWKKMINDNDLKNKDVLLMKIISPYHAYFSKTLPSKFSTYAKISQNCLYIAYSKFGKTRPTEVAGQEVYIPSEVICILNQFEPNPKARKLIESIYK
jgi:hypothetical protein